MNIKLTAIKIIHNRSNRMVYNLYAELFRLIGIYVEEDTIEEYKEYDIDKKKKDLVDYQLFLCIDTNWKTLSFGNDLTLNQNYFIKISSEQYESTNLENIKRRIPILELSMRGILDDMISSWKKMYDENNECLIFLKEKILPIYLKQNVVKGSCLLQYFRMQHPIHKQSQEIFEKTYQDLGKIQLRAIDNAIMPYLIYAKIYSAQKVNLSCYLQKEEALKYMIQELCTWCDKLLELFPDFSNVYVLKGMITEKSREYTTTAIESYRMALEMIKDKSYSSHVYYWLGSLYQKYASGHREAKDAFNAAYNYRPKYRNIYKIGSICADENDYQGVLIAYEECLDTLDAQRKQNLDPLEVEYFYKTGGLACWYAVVKLRQYDIGIELGEKVLSFYEDEFLQTRIPHEHFNYYFGKNAFEYQKISQDRINRNKVYICLAMAYREVNKMKESEYYWHLVNLEK